MSHCLSRAYVKKPAAARPCAQVNGQPIKAFVDSGAQSSIMSQDCARRCNLLHLLDKRFQGMAVGVGSGKIVGQIHQVPCCESAVHAALVESANAVHLWAFSGMDSLGVHRGLSGPQTA